MVSIRGTPVAVADIPAWYQKVFVETQEQLDKVLCGLKFPKFEELLDRRLNPLRPRDAFIDNHGNRDVGYSFLTDKRNGLKEFEGDLLKGIFDNPELNNRFHVYDTDGNPYPRTGGYHVLIPYV
jgi:hypothetical protein